MRIVLREQGRTFVTRTRGAQTAASLVSRATDPELEVDFGDVYASPSFISQFLEGVGQRFGRIRITGAGEHIAETVRRVAARQGLADRVTIEEIVPA